jgi:hypothetical protein
MNLLRPRLISGLSIAVLLAATVAAPALTLARSGGGAHGDVRTIASGGSIAPAVGSFTPSGTAADVTDEEFAGEADNADNADSPSYAGNIVDRSLSSNGHVDSAPTTTGKRAKSNPSFMNGFEGLNLYQQRYARGGNQFTVEPPDQALCVGNGYVVEAVNDVFNVFDHSGNSLLPDNTATNIVAGAPRDIHNAIDLNSFFGYAPAINRSTGVRAEFVTDPSCLYDRATNRFFLVVLTLDTLPNGAFTGVNHIDIAVTATGDPTGSWNIYKLDVTNDGSDIGGSGANAGPYLGDYPHIGADANGFYVTTNAYPWNGPGFGGAQVYAMPKAALAAGAASVNVVHFDTTGMVNAPSDAGDTQPGFTVWPAQSPTAGSGNTEYFLSSNAADEATHPVAGTGGSYVSDQLIVWSMKHTNTLNSASPAPTLSNKILDVNTYAIPPKAQQPGSGSAPGTDVPQGYCINDTTTVLFNASVGCWRLLFGGEPAHNEVVSRPDSNDTRMQQVMFANGKLWGALDTALNPDGGPQRAGIAWYAINPAKSKVVLQGYLGAAGYDFTYPAIGVTSSGRGVMAFTATGDDLNPSAAYASIDAIAGVGPWNVVPGGQGAAPDDGFTSYKSQVGNPPRTRWGDYGAAAVDGNRVWVASQYVATSCDYTDWGGPYFDGGSGDNLLGTCGYEVSPGVWTAGRTALGNWSTYISQFKP